MLFRKPAPPPAATGGAPTTAATPATTSLYDPDVPLLPLGRHGDFFFIRDAVQGVQAFGATGSGKTSGSGNALALAFLKSQFGGLVLCAKPEECPMWLALAEKTRRTKDVRVIRPGGDFRFNFLNYEATRSGSGAGLTVNIVALLMEIIKSIDREERGASEKPFWRHALRQLTAANIDLALFARQPLEFEVLSEIVRSAPRTIADTTDKAWQDSSFCYACIREAEKQNLTEEEKADFDQCRAYWLNDYAGLHHETRSNIVISLTMLLNLFCTRPLRKLLASDTTITPEETFKQRILIIDLPLQEFHQAGRIAQFVWKMMWQKAALRRQNVTVETVPIFLWCDESQNFISDFDPEFQAVARSAKACTVYLTQNISLYKKVLGTGSDDAVESFLGNLQTKIFHQNSGATNEWASNLFGKALQAKITTGETTTAGVSGGSAGESTSETYEERYQILPLEFSQLATGGHYNYGRVEAFMYKGGTRFNETEGRNFIKLTYFQDGYEPKATQ